MSEMFGQELREQPDGAHHGVHLPHASEEEEGES